jgi:hypothetical protein
MIVDILYFEGCPNHGPARDLVKDVLSEYGIPPEIRDIEISDAADAQEKRFLGSPTIRVDGVDVDPSSAARDSFGLMCRVYRQGNVVSGIPPRIMIETAVRIANAKSGNLNEV